MARVTIKFLQEKIEQLELELKKANKLIYVQEEQIAVLDKEKDEILSKTNMVSLKTYEMLSKRFDI